MDNFQEFVVHDDLIRAKAPFSEAAMSRDWKEAKEKLFKLPEETPEIFRIYIHWIYSGLIVCLSLPSQSSRNQQNTQSSLHLRLRTRR